MIIVKISTGKMRLKTLLLKHHRHQVTIVMSLIGAVVPKMFGLIELLEGYHPRTVKMIFHINALQMEIFLVIVM